MVAVKVVIIRFWIYFLKRASRICLQGFRFKQIGLRLGRVWEKQVWGCHVKYEMPIIYPSKMMSRWLDIHDWGSWENTWLEL